MLGWMTGNNVMDEWHGTVRSMFDSWMKLAEASGQSFNRVAGQPFTGATSYFLDNMKQLEASYAGWLKPEPAKTGGTHIALVTGGIGGIGTPICKKFHDLGYRVIATYIKPEAERARQWQLDHAKEGCRFDIIECDVTDFDACHAMEQEIRRRVGVVDILVNCAGITRDATLQKMDEGSWRSVLGTNLNSVFNVTRHFIDGMVERGYGRVINISSVNGQKGQFGQTNYSAAKAGMIGFTKSLAREVAENGVTVNAVCPGYVGTSMVMAVPEKVREAIVAKVPLKRLAKPEEIADVVAFLASDKASYITGSDVSVNGGLFMG